MSAPKHTKKAPGVARSQSSERSKSVRKSSSAKRFPLLPVPVVFFLFTWFFTGIWYGDVLYTAQQYSFFAPDATLMQFVWDRPYGPLWIIGRALLSLFHYPILGGGVLALMLSLICWLTGYSLRLSPRWRPLQYVPAGIYLGCLAYYGFDIYYQHETGMIMGIPICVLTVLTIQSLFIRSFSKKTMPSLIALPTDESPRQNRIGLISCLLPVVCAIILSTSCRPYVRPTAHMQRQMDEQDWDGIIRTAHKHAELSCRPMAALYAIALTQTGQVTEHLFDIRYDFEELFLHNRTGQKDIGTDLYLTDGNYYAGLLQAANRNAIEHLTMEGPTCHMLKRLTQIALLNGEAEVARKYLHILSRTPFETSFVKDYNDLAEHPEHMEQADETKRIRKVEPVNDAFHTQFREPLFLGYNVALLEGRSLEALQNSIAACLYSKMLPEALMRCAPLAGTVLPQNIADAIAIRAHKEPTLLQTFPGNEMTVTRYRGFLQDVRPYVSDRKGHAKKLFPAYQGYYPFYYYFGNLKEATRQTDHSSIDHKGVN